MDIFTAVSRDDEFRKARVALLLEHFSERSDDREPQRVMYRLHEVKLPVQRQIKAQVGGMEPGFPPRNPQLK